jgi:hypothetical protein
LREISLHILDIVQNSIAAGASSIKITALADTANDLLTVAIADNGRGMSAETIERAMSPFWTTRTTRSVGLGIPMFAAAAEACQGGLWITSEVGKGTRTEARFKLSHIDRAPFGDIGATIVDLIVANPQISFRYEQKMDQKVFYLDTEDIHRELGQAPIDALPVRRWMKDYMAEGISRIGAIP